MAAVFFFARKTAARAVHPVPLEIFGTNDESLMLIMQPAQEPKAAAIIHA